MVPTPVNGQGYRLTKWTPEKAEQLVAFLKNYPDTMFYAWIEDHYNGAFEYAGLAQLESAYRFPQAYEVREWQWNGSFDLYRSEKGDIEGLYARLLANVLNNKETSLENLGEWILEVSPEWAVITFPVTPPPSYQKSTVVYFEARANSEASGGFSVWLLEKAGVYTTYALPNGDTSPSRYVSSLPEISDITGDGIEEVFLNQTRIASFGFNSGDITIYQLDQVPPRAITFDIPLYFPQNAEWFIEPDVPVPAITFRVPISVWSDFNCGDYLLDWQYQWQQDQLKLIQVLAPPLKELEENPDCSSILASALQDPEYLKSASAMDLYKRLLELPFIENPDMTGFSTFSVEKARLELAIFLKKQGDEAGANEQIELIGANDDPDKAEWRENALAYYAVHDDPESLYQFCLTAKACKTFLEIDEITGLIPTDKFDRLEDILTQMGIDYRDSGSYDFDGDGNMEKWLFFLSDYPCGSGTELLILGKTSEGIKSRYIRSLCIREQGTIKGDAEIIPVESAGNLPVYQLTVDGVEESMHSPFAYWPLDQKNPTISVQEAQRMIDTIQSKFLLGQITSFEAQNHVKAIQQLPLDPYRWKKESPPQVLYLLGLTYELNGQTQQAIETYLDLWQTYPDSPYAYMAWAKLEPVN